MLTKIFSLLTRPLQLEALAVLVASLVMAAVEVVGVGSIFWFIKLVAEPTIIQENEWLARVYRDYGFTDTKEFLIVGGLALLAIILFRNAFAAFALWLRTHFVNVANLAISNRLLGSYLRRPYAYFLATNSARLSNNVLVEVSNVVNGVIMPTATLVSDGAVAIAMLALLVWHDPLLATSVTMVMGVLFATIYLLVRSRLGHMGALRKRANDGRFKATNEAFAGIKEVKFLGREQYFEEGYAYWHRIFARLHVVSALINQLPRFGIEALAFGGMMVILVYTIAQTDRVSETVGVLALYGAAAYRLMPSLNRILSALTSMRFNRAVVDIICADIEEGERVAVERADRVEPLPFEREIRLRDVSFKYPSGDREVLSSFSLCIPRNLSVGLVGPTGAGKSTVVDVILGLLYPSQGTLEVDGRPVTPATLASWQASVSYVPQHIFLTDDTVLRNIAFGMPDHEIDREAAIEAAKLAHIHDVIVGELPDGYDTTLGERGVRLSGGQRQRIGIARALYRRPKLLVMDEATSALDGITEAVISEAVADLAGNMAMIIIAHRLSTVRQCDVLYLMEGGRIVAEGTFDELMSTNTTFRAMARQVS